MKILLKSNGRELKIQNVFIARMVEQIRIVVVSCWFLHDFINALEFE